MFKTFVFALLAAVSMHFSAFAEVSQGETLERNMWENMKHQNWSAVENSIAPSFQSVHSFGSFNRDQEIDLIKKLYLGNYLISDVKVTEGTDAYIVTYNISVKETIDDEKIPARPTPRMSIWQKINGTWQWVAHANLSQIAPAKQQAQIKVNVLPKKVADAAKTDANKDNQNSGKGSQNKEQPAPKG